MTLEEYQEKHKVLDDEFHKFMNQHKEKCKVLDGEYIKDNAKFQVGDKLRGQNYPKYVITIKEIYVRGNTFSYLLEKNENEGFVLPEAELIQNFKMK